MAPRNERPRRPPSSTGEPDSDGILDLQDATPQEEREWKTRRVLTALAAVGAPAPQPTFHASPRREGARARIRLKVDPVGRLGMHAPGTNTFVRPPLERMARPEVVEAARALETLFSDLSGPRPLEVELRSDGQRVVVVADVRSPSPGGGPWDALVRTMGQLPQVSGIALGRHPALGDPWVRLKVAGVDLRFGPLTFYQVNLEGNEALVSHVADTVAALSPTRLLDAYGGAGNLSFPLAARGVGVTLVEAHPPAVADARANARANGLSVEVLAMDAARLQPGQVFFDVAILDPPREGAGPVIRNLVLTRPRALVVVSCHPPALGRDVREALKVGYRLRSLDLFDLFPLTSHVESVAVLERCS